MAEIVTEETPVIDAPEINYDQLITEDNEPMDNIFSEKQQRLLVEPLYHSWNPGQPFIAAAANVGVFTTPYQPAIVPDMLLSLDVEGEELDQFVKAMADIFIPTAQALKIVDKLIFLLRSDDMRHEHPVHSTEGRGMGRTSTYMTQDLGH